MYQKVGGRAPVLCSASLRQKHPAGCAQRIPLETMCPAHMWRGNVVVNKVEFLVGTPNLAAHAMAATRTPASSIGLRLMIGRHIWRFSSSFFKQCVIGNKGVCSRSRRSAQLLYPPCVQPSRLLANGCRQVPSCGSVIAPGSCRLSVNMRLLADIPTRHFNDRIGSTRTHHGREKLSSDFA
jgi:hypothetical protein